MSAALRLFPSPQDIDDDRRASAQQRALHQPRCGCCGKFAKSSLMQWGGSVCDRCIYDDQRPTIRQKVEQARKWWAMTRPQRTA